MGKLMLTSTFGLVSHKLERIEPDLKGRTVTFIPTAASSSMIYVTGGNTFYLLQSLRYSSADELIAQAVREGKTYIGESAGAVVAGPNIEYIKRMDSEDPAPYLDSNYAGLGLVDFNIVPHIDGPALGESAAEIMRHSNSDDHMVPIRDDQAVLVNGPHIELVER